jgi:hypothetical protein
MRLNICLHIIINAVVVTVKTLLRVNIVIFIYITGFLDVHHILDRNAVIAPNVRPNKAPACGLQKQALYFTDASFLLLPRHPFVVAFDILHGGCRY